MRRSLKRAVRNLIIGKDSYIESRNEFRQVMLSGHYALLALVVIVFYLVRELENGFPETLLAYSLAAGAVLFSLVLHRVRLHCRANAFLFPALNILLFLIVTSESKTTGAMVFFIPLSMGSLAVFNYSHRSIAMLCTLLSFVLFIVSATTTISVLPYRSYSAHQVGICQLVNFTLAFTISFMAVYLLISLNHHYSRQLMESNTLMKKLNEELDRFVYSTSHDLRAPLLSVVGLLRLAENSTQAADVRRYYEMMHIRLSSLDKFITDITDYSRNNRLHIQRERISLAALGNEIWESLKYSPDAREIEFVNDIPEPLTVISDPVRLRVVLGNLMANAIRYHDHRKENKYIRLHYQCGISSFSVHVEDNGQGILPEFHHRIFDMFFRASEASKGSGLGLYIVKETVAKLSGTITLTSKPSLGSTFSVSMPH
jgi:signal transduction histidine kinase